MTDIPIMKTCSERDSILRLFAPSSIEFNLETPLTPFSDDENWEYKDNKIDSTSQSLRYDTDNFDTETTLIKSGPITIDYNECSPIRQIITHLPPYGEVQRVMTYEVAPLVGIIKEIEDVQRQVLYYFSTDNLLKDIYLRSLMDEQGFIPVSNFAMFPKIKKLLPKLPLIEQRSKVLMNAIKLSVPDVFEIRSKKVRLRNTWKRWLIK